VTGLDLRIVSPNATPTEIAAVTAVLTAAVDELSAQHQDERPAESQWQRTRRPLRTPVQPGPGAWRSF
jgi:hypothetical protein